MLIHQRSFMKKSGMRAAGVAGMAGINSSLRRCPPFAVPLFRYYQVRYFQVSLLSSFTACPAPVVTWSDASSKCIPCPKDRQRWLTAFDNSGYFPLRSPLLPFLAYSSALRHRFRTDRFPVSEAPHRWRNGSESISCFGSIVHRDTDQPLRA